MAGSWLRLDALNRVWRTTLQALFATVVASALDAAWQAVQRALAGAAVTGVLDWYNLRDTTPRALGFGALMGLGAYLHRRYVDRWRRVPSAVPPTQPGVPSAVATATVTKPPAMVRASLMSTASTEDWQQRDPAKVRRWTWMFLGATAFVLVPVGMEIWAATDDSANTVPWTEYIARGIPEPVAIAIYLGLVAFMWWLWRHFVQWYKTWQRRDPH